MKLSKSQKEKVKEGVERAISFLYDEVLSDVCQSICDDDQDGEEALFEAEKEFNKLLIKSISGKVKTGVRS